MKAYVSGVLSVLILVVLLDDKTIHCGRVKSSNGDGGVLYRLNSAFKRRPVGTSFLSTHY